MRATHDRSELWDRLTLLLITSPREGWELEFEEITRREIERLRVATRELLSQMVKDGHVKNLGRGQYVHPDNLQNRADNADILTNGKSVSLSALSGRFRKGHEGDDGLGVEEVLEELRRPESGPAKALGTYRERPNEERLQWLTKAVLVARGRDTAAWECYVPAVREALTKLRDAT